MNRRWMKTSKWFCILLLILPWLTGCWDRTELEERGIILGLGIDVVSPEARKHEDQITETNRPDGFPPPGKEMIKLSAQIAVPGRVPLGPGQGGSQGGGGGGGSEKPVWVIQVMGHTLDDALQNLQQDVAQELYLGHLRVVIVGEKLAKKGLKQLLDLLMRDPEIRKSSYLLVSKGTAFKALAVAPPLERVPTLYLTDMMDQAVQMGKFPQSFIGNFFTGYAAKGREGYLPYIQSKGSKNQESHIEIDGIAYFVEDRMVGKTEPMEIAAFLEIMGLKQAGYSLSVPIPKGKGHAKLTGIQRESKVSVEMKGGRPHLKVEEFMQGELEEKSTPMQKINSPQLLKRVDRELERRLEKMQRLVVKKTQEKGSDIFGFGEKVRAQEPDYWNRHIRTNRKWRQVYRTLPVDIQVKHITRRSGMKER